MERKRDSFFLPDKKQKLNIKQAEKSFKKAQKHEKFDETRKGLEKDKTDKKPFDKKTYRLKKYSNKYKLEQWEEQRKKKLLRNYYKEVKNDPMAGTYKPVSFDEDEEQNTDANIGRYVRHPDRIDEADSTSASVPSKQKDPFWKAKDRLNKIKEEKENKKKEIEKAKEEKAQKLLEYKKKKQERFKKLSKKTKKGQPVMSGRLEMLLEKIKK